MMHNLSDVFNEGTDFVERTVASIVLGTERAKARKIITTGLPVIDPRKRGLASLNVAEPVAANGGENQKINFGLLAEFTSKRYVGQLIVSGLYLETGPK